MSRRGTCNVRRYLLRVSQLVISCTRRRRKTFPIIVTFSITNSRRVLASSRSRSSKVMNAKFIVCDLIRVRGVQTISRAHECRPRSVNWITTRNFYPRPSWGLTRRSPSRYRVKSAGVILIPASAMQYSNPMTAFNSVRHVTQTCAICYLRIYLQFAIYFREENISACYYLLLCNWEK